MGTANIMHIMAEAMGMAPPGSAPVAARSERLERFAREAGHRVVDLVNRNILPRHIRTSFHLDGLISSVTLAYTP
jgi:dihydroxy-acid dehydratase